MPENPLLPHRQLREMYALMLRCREMERKARRAGAAEGGSSREAILAATAMHLVPGDLLCAAPGDATLASLAPADRAGSVHGGLVTPPVGKLTTAASMARGQMAASPPGELSLTLAFSTAGTAEPGWQQALTVAQHVGLPLILAVADGTGNKRSRSKAALSWDNISVLARRYKLAVLSVDGEDAVALYRVMQESVIRARHGGGPAVIWAATSGTALPRKRQPLARLEEYMKTRKISLPRKR